MPWSVVRVLLVLRRSGQGNRKRLGVASQRQRLVRECGDRKTPVAA